MGEDDGSPPLVGSELILVHTGVVEITLACSKVSDEAKLRKLTRWDLKQYVTGRLADLEGDIVDLSSHCGTFKSPPRAAITLRKRASVLEAQQRLHGTRHVFAEQRLAVRVEACSKQCPQSGGGLIAEMSRKFLEDADLDLYLPEDLSEQERHSATQDMAVAFKHLPPGRRPDTLRLCGLPKRWLAELNKDADLACSCKDLLERSFGKVSALEALAEPKTATPNKIDLGLDGVLGGLDLGAFVMSEPTVDVCVQFAEYASMSKALEAFTHSSMLKQGGSVVCNPDVRIEPAGFFLATMVRARASRRAAEADAARRKAEYEQQKKQAAERAAKAAEERRVAEQERARLQKEQQERELERKAGADRQAEAEREQARRAEEKRRQAEEEEKRILRRLEAEAKRKELAHRLIREQEEAEEEDRKRVEEAARREAEERKKQEEHQQAERERVLALAAVSDDDDEFFKEEHEDAPPVKKQRHKSPPQPARGTRATEDNARSRALASRDQSKEKALREKAMKSLAMARAKK
eukprot:TRINITY_DN34051_c0_g1_i2.p1 TRINITY_DN34051_c0_g1~~TRINITY_DN34051_c0_g1_i2.p1  ORF type:complete len:524 (+),score=156.51 TRINITY_DN34051_c0_g1_i2:170-1741(+)